MPRKHKNKRAERNRRRRRIDPNDEPPEHPDIYPPIPEHMGFNNSSEPVEAGEFVYRGLPLAFAMRDEFLWSHCNYCMSGSIGFACAGCKVMRYCNANCQELDHYHVDVECHHLRQQRPNVPSSFIRYIGELVVNYKKDVHKLNGEALTMRAITFEELDYCRHQVQDVEELEEMSYVYDYLSDYLDSEYMISYTDFKEVYCKGKQYMTKVYLPQSYRSKAIAFYLGLMLFTHSCNPTGVQSWNSREMYIYTIKDLPLKVEFLVTINRLGYFAKERARRKELMAKECISICSCSICCDEKDEPFSELFCEPDFHLVKKVQLSWRIAKRIRESNRQDTEQILQIATIAWEDMDGVFGPLHALRAKFARLLTSIHFQKGQYREARKYCLRLLDFCEEYYGYNHMRTALVKLLTSIMDAYLGKEESSARHYDQGFRRFQNCLGTSNLFFFNVWRDYYRLCRQGGWTVANIEMMAQMNSVFKPGYLEIY